MAKKASLLLNLAGLAPAKVCKILKHLDDIDQLFQLKRSELAAFSFLEDNDVRKILSLINSREVDAELALIEKYQVKTIDIFDPDYPYLLSQIHSPPLILYAKGDIKLLKSLSIAVVGARNSSSYGKTVAFDFSYQLASLGVNVVSGLARGIDTQAHRGALEAGGPTTAVLGSGLSYIYPYQNQKLAHSIFNKGLVISEYPMREKPLPQNFPRRNRIISGLAKGVMIVEAAKRSGSLITANFAVSQNREVFAVPGLINQQQSEGTNALIKEGAKLAASVDDLLEELNLAEIKQDKLNVSGDLKK